MIIMYIIMICKIQIFYDDNKRKGKSWIIPLKNNHFVMFPSTNTHTIINEQKDNLNFVVFQPITGRNHQIRIHSKELGIPILGDKRYGNVEDDEKLHLHSRSVEFYHPNGSKMFFEAELPKHMKEKWEKYDLPYEVNI